jgi:HSP20 family protein
MLYPTIRRTRAPNLWDQMFNIRNGLGSLADAEASGTWYPVVDVREAEGELVLQAELPGLRSEDVNVGVENGVLTISGEKKQHVEEGHEGSNYRLVERRYGRFERSFTLPRSVDAQKVQAEFANGLLTVTLPKAEAAKPRRIEVQVSKN